MKFNEINPFEYNKYTFGEIIKERREELGLSLRSVAKKLGMLAMYLSDIERGNRTPPIGNNVKEDYMSKIIKVLQIPNDQVDIFYDIAYASKYGISKKIKDYINNNTYIENIILLAMNSDLSDEDWQKIISYISQR